MSKESKNKQGTLELIARTVAEIKSDVTDLKKNSVTKTEFLQLKTQLAEFQLETAQNFKNVRTDIINLHKITDRLELEH